MSLKPGPKPIAKSTGKVDQRRRDNKDTPGNTPALKPSKKKWSIYFISYRQRLPKWWPFLYPEIAYFTFFSLITRRF